MSGRWFKKVLVYGAELLVAIAFVLVFFFASMTILGMSFPKGAGLRDLMGGSTYREDAGAAARLRFDRPGRLKPGVPRIVARLVDVREKVKDKRSDRIDWADANAGAPLEERHAVQTFARSSAVIAFEGHGDVTLRENSLVVLGAAASDQQAARGSVSLLVTSGALREAFGGKPGSEGNLRVITASGEARLGWAAPSTEFQVSVNPDRTSTFAVYKGSSEITAAGRTVTVGANQAIVLTPGQPPGEPIALPGEPELASPGANALVPFRSVPPRVAFTWQPVPSVTGYHVQLASDPGFANIVDDDRVGGPGFDQGSLGPGEYFWRVSAMRGNAEGAASVTRQLTIVEDVAPPFLHVSFPDGPVDQTTIVVRGETEPGADVFVGGVRVATDATGRFNRSIELGPGWNVVVVEAIDAAGNVAYQSQRLMIGASLRARSR